MFNDDVYTNDYGFTEEEIEEINQLAEFDISELIPIPVKQRFRLRRKVTKSRHFSARFSLFNLNGIGINYPNRPCSPKRRAILSHAIRKVKFMTDLNSEIAVEKEKSAAA